MSATGRASGLENFIRPRSALSLIFFLLSVCSSNANISQREPIAECDADETAMLQSARRELQERSTPSNRADAVSASHIAVKLAGDVGRSTSGMLQGKTETNATKSSSGAEESVSSHQSFGDSELQAESPHRAEQDLHGRAGDNSSRAGGLEALLMASPHKTGLHHAFFVQVSAAALRAVDYLASPGSAIPSVAPVFAAILLLIACGLAVYHCLSTPIFNETRRPQETRAAMLPVRRGWPAMSDNSSSKGAIQDPYAAYMSSATLPSKTQASLMPSRPGTGIPGRPSLNQASTLPQSLAQLPRQSVTAASLPVSGHSTYERNGAEPAGESDKTAGSNGPPPPLYAALVLPAREAHLEIPLNSLETVKDSGVGRFFVLGPLGNKIMHVTLCGSAFDVHMASSELVASVSLQWTDSKPRLEICGPDGVIYGNVLERQSFGSSRTDRGSTEKTSFSVVVRSTSGEAVHDLLLITGNPEDMRFTATSAVDGQPVASASPETSRHTRAGRKLDIRTQRRADTALVLSCFVAIILLHPKRAA